MVIALVNATNCVHVQVWFFGLCQRFDPLVSINEGGFVLLTGGKVVCKTVTNWPVSRPATVASIETTAAPYDYVVECF